MWPFSLFKPKSKKPQLWTTPRADAVLYEVGGGWGNCIRWRDRVNGELRRVVGWKLYHPREGDVLLCEMESGKTGVWIFQKVEPCGDPPDMFFADVNPIDYVDEVSFPLPPLRGAAYPHSTESPSNKEL